MAHGIRYSVGYQLIEDGKIFSEIVRDFRKSIDEVYFAWVNFPSGRAPLANKSGYINWEAQKQIEYELQQIKRLGIKLNLLLNASCWGDLSLSKSLSNTVVSLIDYLGEQIGIDSITTFSPAIAYVVKKNFPEIEIKASVNMRIGTTRAMEQLSDLFDSFVMQREYNRNMQRIGELKDWCEKNGKRLTLLANSGCINFCPVQIFHDNVIAHEKEILTKENLTEEIPGNCWSYYRKKENWKMLLCFHSWIRPEDIHYYKNFFKTMKLATRMSQQPERIIRAYCEGKFEGNLLDLFEPSHSALLFPFILKNSKFPGDWFRKTLECKKDCSECSFCEKVFDEVLIKVGG